MTINLQALLPYVYNCSHGLIFAQVSDFFGSHSPVDSVSKIMKLCDYDVAENSKFIACRKYSFYSVAKIACYWQHVSALAYLKLEASVVLIVV